MNAYLALERADRWVFVGYSLPDEDLAIRSMLYRALDARTENEKVTNIEVVALPADKEVLEKRYSGLFKGPATDVRYVGTKFCDYVRGMQAGATVAPTLIV